MIIRCMITLTTIHMRGMSPPQGACYRKEELNKHHLWCQQALEIKTISDLGEHACN
jgi:hypothetical protein